MAKHKEWRQCDTLRDSRVGLRQLPVAAAGGVMVGVPRPQRQWGDGKLGGVEAGRVQQSLR